MAGCLAPVTQSVSLSAALCVASWQFEDKSAILLSINKRGAVFDMVCVVHYSSKPSIPMYDYREWWCAGICISVFSFECCKYRERRPGVFEKFDFIVATRRSHVLRAPWNSSPVGWIMCCQKVTCAAFGSIPRRPSLKHSFTRLHCPKPAQECCSIQHSC